MSAKTATQQPRRAPLSLSGGKQHNQNSGKSADSNVNSSNGASAKNDKHSASQKVEPTINDTKEVKKSQHTEKKQPQQQQSVNNETTKKNEKVDEKKSQNGTGKDSTNGGEKEKQQNGADKQENGNANGTNAKSGNTNSNSNATAKLTTKSNEKTATPVVKEDVKDLEKEKEKEKEKKKENGQEKVIEKIEKETRSRRHDTAAAEAEKKQTEKTEPNKSDETKTEVATPNVRSSASQAKSSATPTKGVNRSSGANTPTKAVEKSSASLRTKTVTTVIDDAEMESLAVESSPVKPQKNSVSTAAAPAVVSQLQPPVATSTPGKILQSTQKVKLPTTAAKSEIPINIQNTGSLPDRNSAPRTFTQIGGRRSIRPINEYTPSKFQSNSQFRESYRRINTELDVSSTTNTSMNVTVGSEVPNSSSFSFFGRGRKRDRTPPQQSQSTIEMHTDAADYSPPKRARLDMYSFFSVVSSPITMLRSRLSKATIQSSTPMKLSSKLADDDEEAEVQNVSGISIEEEIVEGAESEEKTATEDVTVGKKSDAETAPKTDSPMKVDEICGMEKGDEIDLKEGIEAKSLDIHELPAVTADTSVTSAKNRRCNVM
ncbi:neurofilament heavy polypeptide [Anastrepha ludens]|uniref:neurofilament heavy polypeptide n=1 Tax=Anastrepha ludens TaxID=28586 RepID=UPI0023B0E7DB|nr:neurofilament heavy polypeptide [Anastrepha ludens]XP_053946841.1 neurofilament heavy polypeptide [Anastrepha ludens]XP_053946842.1 neurofilament heavy polypeptide [Anastrepha ludens]XP_053946843.1 neurofilament heavy polypeptide [Anastrepha ludens]